MRTICSTCKQRCKEWTLATGEEFFVDTADEFRSTSSNCDTAYFGKFGYRYTGGSYEVKPMPPVLENLLEQLRPHFSNPTAVVNFCLVRRFKDV